MLLSGRLPHAGLVQVKSTWVPTFATSTWNVDAVGAPSRSPSPALLPNYFPPLLLSAQRLPCAACLATPPPPLVSRPARRRRLAMLREQREAADDEKDAMLGQARSTWRRDGLASGWRRPSAGLRVITPRASGSPPPRPRLVGAGTQQWPAELSAGSSIDGNRAIMRAAQRGLAGGYIHCTRAC